MSSIVTYINKMALFESLICTVILSFGPTLKLVLLGWSSVGPNVAHDYLAERWPRWFPNIIVSGGKTLAHRWQDFTSFQIDRRCFGAFASHLDHRIPSIGNTQTAGLWFHLLSLHQYVVNRIDSEL